MIVTLRSIWSGIRASYWFYPALFTVVGFVLALAGLELDDARARHARVRNEVISAVPSAPS